MNKRLTIYYLMAAYCGYTAYSLVKDMQAGAPVHPVLHVILVGFFAVAAVALALYTTILARREKDRAESEEKDDSQG